MQPQREPGWAVRTLQAGPVCPSSSPASQHHFLFQPHELLPFHFSILSFQGPWCRSEPGSVVAITSGHQHPWPARTPCHTPALPWDREGTARLARKPFAGHHCRQQRCLLFNVFFQIAAQSWAQSQHQGKAAGAGPGGRYKENFLMSFFLGG